MVPQVGGEKLTIKEISLETILPSVFVVRGVNSSSRSSHTPYKSMRSAELKNTFRAIYTVPEAEIILKKLKKG